jgi:NADPH:quinone reductase-like Zn-dependent oxidoreductase
LRNPSGLSVAFRHFAAARRVMVSSMDASGDGDQTRGALNMDDASTSPGLQLRSLVTADGKLRLYLDKMSFPDPAEDEVVIEIEAAPINPSDIGVLIGPADLDAATSSGEGDGVAVTARIPDAVLPTLAGRFGEGLSIGNEGAGRVVAAGSAAEAQALIGRTVAFRGGAMFATWRAAPAKAVVPLPAGITANEGASFFVNPMTALAMVETMRSEGHRAIVHTAAASSLGRMLNRLCVKDGIALVNVVRRDEQVQLLRAEGARWVLNSSSADFPAALAEAVAETDATIAFDATFGGTLTDQILTAMESAATRNLAEFSRYGSSVFKQVYIYGGLDPRRFELGRGFGLHWSVSGFLLSNFLQKAGADVVERMRARISSELATTFASHYTDVISLVEALDLETMRAYGRQATAKKFLIKPTLRNGRK